MVKVMKKAEVRQFYNMGNADISKRVGRGIKKQYEFATIESEHGFSSMQELVQYAEASLKKHFTDKQIINLKDIVCTVDTEAAYAFVCTFVAAKVSCISLPVLN